MNNAVKIIDDERTGFDGMELDQVWPFLEMGGLFDLGEAYMAGKWSSTDLVALMSYLFTERLPIRSLNRKLTLRSLFYVLGDVLIDAQSGLGAYKVAEEHYDLGNDLFEQMLDETMTYTCGYWKNSTTLYEAQEAKLRLLCDKLHLQPGMRVLDIGCGWGNFAAFAAKWYGVSVVGLTVSREQAEYARRRCSGLSVEILLADYRDYHGTFDRIVSIEMIEAVGRKNIPGFFDMVRRCLKDRGLFALQAISAESFSYYSKPTFDQFILWLRKRIFPNGYLPTFSQLATSERKGLIVEDVENFGVDYATTLQAWSTNFQQGWLSGDLRLKYGDRFKRMWEYYLAGCEALFRARMVQLYQIVYSYNRAPEVSTR